MQTAHCVRMRSKTGYAEFGYFYCYLKMDAPRALVFRPLVKGNEALGTRLEPHTKECEPMLFVKKYVPCLRDLSNSFSNSFIDFYSCEVVS